MTVARLDGRRIGLSISDSPDLARLGLGTMHLHEATIEIARHLLRAGAVLVYGGDLRPGGFTRALFEAARAHSRTQGSEPVIVNYLAWPVLRSLAAEDLEALNEEFEPGYGRVMPLGPQGEDIPADELRRNLEAAVGGVPTPGDWASGLSALRARLTRECHARVLLGGRTDGYRGRGPGLVEEAILALRSGRPLYLAGGFGGCTRDLIAALGYRRDWFERPADEVGEGYWEMLTEARQVFSGDLRNGLDATENEGLFAAASVPRILRAIMRGLSHVLREGVGSER